MNIADRNTFCKAERLNSKTAIERLFSGDSKSLAAYPLRAVYMSAEKKQQASVSVLISVPKKKFKRAVKRNRVKRQIREAYRKNKHVLSRVMNEKEEGLVIAFIYLHDQLVSSQQIEEKVKNILARIIEKLE